MRATGKINTMLLMSTAHTPPFLSIVFSFRNEEDVLVELIRRTRAAMQDARHKGLVKNHELIFVNDASSDNSLVILLERDKGHNDIRIINMSRTFGVAPCVMAGLAHAQGDAIVLRDTSEVVRKFDRLAQQFDVPPSRIHVEATVITVRLNPGLPLGVDLTEFNSSGQAFSVTPADAGTTGPWIRARATRSPKGA